MATSTAASRPSEFSALTDHEIDALYTALKQNEFSIELHIGPTTLVGAESRSNSMLSQLREELRTSGEFGSNPGQVGRDVLGAKTVPISQDSIDRAATDPKTTH
jgi:hypothetical protein